MDAYSSLQKLYYKANSPDRDTAIINEAQKRLNDASSFKLGIRIEGNELFLAVPTQLSILSEKLLRVERKVSQLWHELPGIARWAYLRGLIINEIFSTNEIEGVRSTRRQIEEALKSAEQKTKTSEFKRFKELANLYLELTNKDHIYPVAPSDIRKIYDAVVSGELDESQQPDGELFRKEAVDVITSTQKVVHRGVMPESEIARMLQQMIDLVHSHDIPNTFTALMAHFLFEYIHPFYDGNGRTGRYLLSLYLSEPLSLATVLSLSPVIAENKSKYYRIFTDAEARLNYGELTFFVLQMMEFIRIAQDAVIENLEEKKLLLQKADESLSRFEESPYFLSKKEIRVMFQAVQHYLFDAFPEVSLEDIARFSDVGLQTARKYTLSLEEKKLFQKVSHRPLRFELTKEALAVFGLAEN